MDALIFFLYFPWMDRHNQPPNIYRELDSSFYRVQPPNAPDKDPQLKRVSQNY